MLEQDIQELTVAVKALTTAMNALYTQGAEIAAAQPVAAPQTAAPKAEPKPAKKADPKPEPVAEKPAEKPAEPVAEPAKQADTAPEPKAEKPAEPAPAPTPEPVAEKPAEPASTAKEYDIESIKALVKEVFTAKGGDVVTATLKDFGTSRVSEIPPERFPELVALLEKVRG